MTVRLAFCGASGTGKSTFVEQVAVRLGLPTMPSFARLVASDLGLSSPYEADAKGLRDELQLLVVQRQLTWQQAHQRSGFVSDRSLFDGLVYTVMHASERARWEVIHLVKHHVARGFYSRLVLCPIASFHNVGGDPARVQDRSYHLEYERLLRTILNFHGVPFDSTLDAVAEAGRSAWFEALMQELRP